MPSRVRVEDVGNADVASRGFGIQGTVSKIAGSLEGCVDRNNNGSIETSRDGNPLAYGADECVIWTVPVGPPNALLRAMTIDLGSAQVPNGFVWVGGYNSNELYKLHPDDGRLLATVPVPTAPYGLTIVNNGDLYMSTLGDGTLVRLTLPLTWWRGLQIREPAVVLPALRWSRQTRGRVWQNGWDTMDAIGYDPADAPVPTASQRLPVGRRQAEYHCEPRWPSLDSSWCDGASHCLWDTELCRPGGLRRFRGMVPSWTG